MSSRFDKKAKEMDQNPVIQQVAKSFARTLKSRVRLSSQTRALDFGCGSGLVGMQLYSEVGSLTMMDTSAGMLALLKEKIAQNKITNMAVLNCDIFTAATLPAEFDLIYMNSVLHHIEDIPAFLEKIRSMLKPGGQLCIGDLKAEGGTFHHDNTGVHHFGFAEQDLRSRLNAGGFTVTHCEEHYTIRRPDSADVMRDYPLFFCAATKA